MGGRGRGGWWVWSTAAKAGGDDVDGHLQPSAQQHNPHWQQISLSINDSQHVSGGTPAFKQQRLTQQRHSPLHDAPQHLRRRRRGARQNSARRAGFE